MQKILVPTDLSPNSNRAFHYAVNFAKDHGGIIYLLHVYYLADLNARGPVLRKMQELIESVNPDINIIAAEENKPWPDKNVPDGKQGNPVYCRLLVRQGFAEEEIMNAAIQTNTDLIIMGTLGSTGMGYWLFGSTTAHLIQKSEHPILAIPPGGKYKPFTHVAYATDLSQENDENADQLMKFIRIWQARLQLVHVKASGEMHQMDELQRLAEKLQEKYNTGKIPIMEIDASTVIDGFQEYIRVKNPSLLAMTSRQRGMIARLNDRSTTSEVLFKGWVPVLAFHG